MTASFPMALAKLKSASPEANDLWSHRPNRGTMRLKSGVIGFTVKRNPTWITFPTIATTKTTTRSGKPIRTSQPRKECTRVALSASGSAAREK